MRTIFKRETMIALRAQREAARVARSIQNPPMKVDPPAAPSMGARVKFTPSAFVYESKPTESEPEIESRPGHAIELAIFYVLLLIVLWMVTSLG